MKALFHKGFRFLALSGIGWLIDFSIFYVLTKFWFFPVAVANIISSIPAVTFVFFTSTRYVFIQHTAGLSIRAKYMIYVAYQLCVIFLVSALAQLLFNKLADSQLSEYSFFQNNGRLMIKILITPVTMVLNFLAMNGLIERL